jgi:hypothetical protein
LDIDPKSGPDVLCDARDLFSLQAAQYDAVYCSHNLEHYYRHDVPKVLAGFLHVLRPEGFAEVRVPDMGGLMTRVVRSGLDIDDVAYQSPAGPITVRDVIYGYGVEIERSGCDFYAHKTGFTKKSLCQILARAGFAFVYAAGVELEVIAVAFREKPTEHAMKLFGLSAPAGPGLRNGERDIHGIEAERLDAANRPGDGAVQRRPG